MSLTTTEWHKRYSQQAQWTKHLRAYLYQKARLEEAARILDIGCGTGVLEQELSQHTSTRTLALDIDASALDFAMQYSPHADYTQGTCLSLPYASDSFEVAFCHFLLLWVKDLPSTLDEMKRVVRPGGFILALAEPDYGGRIDYPYELAKIGNWQAAALTEQGANPFIGRELRSVFHTAGLVDIESGVMGGEWRDSLSEGEDSIEWQVIRADLAGNREFLQQADSLQALDLSSCAHHERILFVPTFYAIGMVSK